MHHTWFFFLKISLYARIPKKLVTQKPFHKKFVKRATPKQKRREYPKKNWHKDEVSFVRWINGFPHSN